MKRLLLALPLLAAVACQDSTSPGDPAASSPDLSSLPVGKARTLTLAQASGGLTIPASLASAQYLVVVSSISPDSGQIVSYQVQGNWNLPSSSTAASATFSVAPSSIQLSIQPGFQRSPRGSSFPERFESRLRAFERAKLRTDYNSGIRQTVTPRAPRYAVGDGDTLVTGDTTRFKVTSAGGDACDVYANTVGVVRYVSNKAIFVVDTATPSGTLTNTDFQTLGAIFDATIYPADVDYFGTPSDIDNNNGKIVIYYTPEVNKLTPRGSDGVVGGFFFSGDLFPKDSASAVGGRLAPCTASNFGEIFYLLAPDPSGVFSDPVTVDFVLRLTRGTIAHEFQHMINAGTRLYKSNVAGLEEGWMDEALAHFAEDAVGRAAAPPGGVTNGPWDPLHKITLQELGSLDGITQSAYFAQNMARTKYFLGDPSAASAMGNDEHVSQSLEYRGASWSFLRYVADWYSNNNVKAFTKRLVAGPETGVDNITKQAGVPIDSLLGRWLITLYTDGAGISGVPNTFSYRSYEWRPIIMALNAGPGYGAGVYGVVPRQIGNGTNSVSASFVPGGGSYFLVNQTASGERRVTFTPSSDPKGRVFIIRLQ